jgi:hypothetical protein
MYCRPPHGEGNTQVESDDMFCSWNHALVYYNNGRVSQKDMFAEREMSKKITIPLTDKQKTDMPQLEVEGITQ